MRSFEEVPEAWGNTGKSKEKVSFGAKKVGWGRDEKMGFTADFAIP